MLLEKKISCLFCKVSWAFSLLLRLTGCRVEFERKVPPNFPCFLHGCFSELFITDFLDQFLRMCPGLVRYSTHMSNSGFPQKGGVPPHHSKRSSLLEVFESSLFPHSPSKDVPKPKFLTVLRPEHHKHELITGFFTS